MIAGNQLNQLLWIDLEERRKAGEGGEKKKGKKERKAVLKLMTEIRFNP